MEEWRGDGRASRWRRSRPKPPKRFSLKAASDAGGGGAAPGKRESAAGAPASARTAEIESQPHATRRCFPPPCVRSNQSLPL